MESTSRRRADHCEGAQADAEGTYEVASNVYLASATNPNVLVSEQNGTDLERVQVSNWVVSLPAEE